MIKILALQNDKIMTADGNPLHISDGLSTTWGGFKARDLKRGFKARVSGVADGTRTHDDRNHNPGLYQLSYGHHCKLQCYTLGREAVRL
jgi:hypothetical protein